VRDLAVDDRQHRDVAVAVGGSGRDGTALRGVFEDDDVRGLVVVDGQVIATIKEECGAIGTVQLGYGLAPFDAARVARDRNDVLEDDVLGQQVEKVLAVHQAGHAFLDDPEERVQGPEVVEFPDGRHRGSSRARAAAVRRAWPLTLVLLVAPGASVREAEVSMTPSSDL
jgi:hypothetical protein